VVYLVDDKNEKNIEEVNVSDTKGQITREAKKILDQSFKYFKSLIGEEKYTEYLLGNEPQHILFQIASDLEESFLCVQLCIWKQNGDLLRFYVEQAIPDLLNDLKAIYPSALKRLTGKQSDTSY